MKEVALRTVLSQKMRDNEIIFLDEIKLSEPKTKAAKAILTDVAKIPALSKISGGSARTFVIFPEVSEPVARAFGNIGSIRLGTPAEMNAAEALRYRYVCLVSPENLFSQL